jgi:hypothetical protein
MSFLNVTGKIYHCKQCKKEFQINYKGGSRITQIGDSAVFEQMALSQKYGQPNKNPERQGYYLHDDSYFCEECFNLLYKNSDGSNILSSDDPIATIDFFIKECIKMLKDIKTELIKEWMDDLTLDRLKSINPSLNIVNTLESITQFIDGSGNLLLENLYNKLLLDCAIQAVLKAFQEEFDQIIPDVQKILASDVTDFYIEYIVGDEENLNKYIEYELTTRIPVSSTPKYKFYKGPMHIPRYNIHKNIKNATPEGLIELTEWEYSNLKKMLQKKMEVLLSQNNCT